MKEHPEWELNLRVLINIGRLARGGAERQTVQLTAGLVRRGHSCVLAVGRPIEAYQEELARSGAAVRVVGSSNRFDPRTPLGLLTLAARFRPNVVLSVMFSATLWGRVSAAAVGVPAITAEHGTTSTWPAKTRICNAVFASRTAAVIACASEQVDSLVLAGNRRDRIVVIPNGVDTSALYPDAAAGCRFRDHWGIPKDAVVVGLVAAHRREKRHDRFVRVMESVMVDNKDVWACIVGGGALYHQNRALAARSAVAERLVVAGAQSDMQSVYNALDIVTLVSDLNETFPLCFLEAQACGCVVVGMDTSGVRSTFKLGQSGLLVDQGDEKAMISQLTMLIKNPSRRRAMGEFGRCWVDDCLSEERMIDRYEYVLEAVAASRGRRIVLA